MLKKGNEEMASNTHLNDSIGVARSGDSSNSPLLLRKKVLRNGLKYDSRRNGPQRGLLLGAQIKLLRFNLS